MKRRVPLFVLLPLFAGSFAHAGPFDKPPVDKATKEKPGDSEKKPADKPLAEGSAIIKDIAEIRKLGDWDLKVDDLAQKPGTTLPKESNQQFEVYRLATQQHAEDIFTYRIVLDRKSNEYWIVRSGGFAGMTITCGPAIYRATPAKKK